MIILHWELVIQYPARARRARAKARLCDDIQPDVASITYLHVGQVLDTTSWATHWSVLSKGHELILIPFHISPKYAPPQ